MLRKKERLDGESRYYQRRRTNRLEEPAMESIHAMSVPYDADEEISFDAALPPIGSIPDMAGKSLEEVLGDAGESFQQLFMLIDESGMDDVTV